MKILIVDDEPMTLQSLFDSLSNFYTVVTAENGIIALSKFRKDDDFDVVVTDFSMPRMNGVELVKHIRGLTPAQRIIMMTSDVFDAEKFLKAENLSVDILAQKPVSGRELRGIISGMLG